MPLHPTCKSLIQARRQETPPSELSIDEVRNRYATFLTPERTGAYPEGIAEHSLQITPEVKGTFFLPPLQEGDSLPIILYFHGGGWCIGSSQIYASLLAQIASLSELPLLSIDYRLAPEYPFPAAWEDCWAAFEWLSSHAAEHHGNPKRIILMGDSAGGTLAAVVAQQALEKGVAPQPFAQVLIYPVTDFTQSFPSMDLERNVTMGSKEDLKWLYDQVAGEKTSRRDPRLSPLWGSSIQGLPPTLILTAEYDLLRDEAEAYGQRLLEEGVSVQMKRYPGMIHGFFPLGGLLKSSREAMAEVVHFIKEQSVLIYA